MRATCLLFLLLPAIAAAGDLDVREIRIHPVERLARPDLEADPIARALAAGTWTAPAVGDTAWHAATADSAGWIEDETLRRSYALATVTVPRDTTVLLEAMGYQTVLVNGEPRVGNIYGYTDQWQSWQPHFDFSLLPVHLHAGANELLFFGNRYGLLRARFLPADAPLMLNPRDTTLPDLVVGEAIDTWGAIVVMNATAEVVTDAKLTVTLAGAAPEKVTVPVLPPFGVRKVGFPVRGAAPAGADAQTLAVALSRHGATLAAIDLELAVKQPHENRRVTFLSHLDDSVQYYGFLPALGEPGSKALVLSLHGAAVEALNQSGSYAPLAWGHVVAPTNRRPFGFNWEDWGRLDALEVLDLAQERLDIAPDRVYLTGHSMGGHGSWHLATLHPGRFAAVGPSAGWISFWSYRPDRSAEPASPLAVMLDRATLPSRTLETAPNLAGLGVYILHGDEDQVVSVNEARAMRQRLSGFHRDFDWHDEPGAGHWWDNSDAPGADCVAWAPMFDFFARRRRPATDEVRELRFVTPSPGVAAWHRWACVARQERSFVMSGVDLALDPLAGTLAGATENVTVLGIDARHVAVDTLRLELDGETIAAAIPDDGAIWLERDDVWRVGAVPDPALKGPQRHGGFREAFRHRVQLVYATGGDAEENAWARARARYDAEHLWYQGNGTADVLPDTLYNPGTDPHRNVILYGNADTHGHWRVLWPHADVTVSRGGVVAGGATVPGDGTGLLAVRPRPGSDTASVGVVGGSGLAGCRLTDRRPYLRPGVAYPDLTVLRDLGDGRVVAGAGFFGPDWSPTGGELVWAQPE